MQAAVYSKEGKEVGKVELPEGVFGAPWNADLVHQVVTGMLANARTPVAHTKTRGEVRGGGKKPWKQKGTGRARHGSTRSPIWVGGGVTFGPRNDQKFAKKINRKMRARALYAALSRKLKDGEVVFLDTLTFEAPKTKDAKAMLVALSQVPALKALAGKKKNAALIALPENDMTVRRSFQNIGNVVIEEVRNLNPVDVLSYKYLVVAHPEKSVATLQSKRSGKKEDVKKAEPKASVTAPRKTVAKTKTSKAGSSDQSAKQTGVGKAAKPGTAAKAPAKKATGKKVSAARKK